ncbi:MBL fold metallo-hydrolase [Leucobacter sp. G161]|nr:MBL fold metallo-hydrolase [Leucobacter sp. G161]
MKKPHVITLGTAGGPRWWTPMHADSRFGISTAVVVGGRNYLVDVGAGAGRQYTRAGLDIADLKGIFLTHLHSDHTTDLGNIALFGMFGLNASEARIPIIGPGDRGMLPPVSTRALTPPSPVAPHLPTPGTRDMFRLLMEAHATDLNDRVLDALRPSPLDLFDATDIRLPEGIGYHPNSSATPDMEPFVVFEDDRVQVEAILVEHPPIAPAFAYRFNTEEGAVVISGDTAKTRNMVTLSRGAQLLLHEAISFSWVDQSYAESQHPVHKASRDHHRKSHSSVEDAVSIAAEAGVTQLAIHHLVPGSLSSVGWRAELGQQSDVLLPNDLEIIPFHS